MASDGAALHNIWHGFVTVQTLVPLYSTEEEEVWEMDCERDLPQKAPPVVEIWGKRENDHEGSVVPLGSFLAPQWKLSWGCLFQIRSGVERGHHVRFIPLTPGWVLFK
jgi:hypothetical protein